MLLDTNLPPNVYQVTVRCTEASQRCNLIGDYLISLESDALLLLDGNTSDIIYCWPYKMIRKYGQVEVKSKAIANRFVQDK